MSGTVSLRPRTKFIHPVIKRMRCPAIILSFVIALAASVAQGAVVQATAGMSIDGSEWSVPVGFNPELGLYGIGSWDSKIDNFTGYQYLGEDGTKVNISGVLDPDPAISYTIGVTDFGAPSVFGFFFGSPIVIGATPTTVDASVVGGLTDFSGNGVAMAPTAAFLQISDVGPPSTNMGVNVGGPGGGGPGAPGALYGYGPFADGPQPGPAGPWAILSVTVGFSLSGGQDSFALTGFSQIVEVPEPSSVCMLAIATVGLVFFARRRRRG